MNIDQPSPTFVRLAAANEAADAAELRHWQLEHAGASAAELAAATADADAAQAARVEAAREHRAAREAYRAAR